jgi:ABC-type transporter Mla subunit MlaD
MNDRALGYLLLVSFAVLFVGIGVYYVRSNYYPAEVRVIEFSHIGNLKIEDPVAVHGAVVGKIKAFSRSEAQVYVTIAIERKLQLHQDYRAISIDKGLMGDRIIEINPGDSLKPLVSPSDTLRGNAVPGISEAVGLAWKLKQVVDSYLQTSALFLNGNAYQESFCTKFNTLVHKIDSASIALLGAFGTCDHDVSPKLDSLGKLLAEASAVSRDAADGAEKYKVQIRDIFGKADSLVGQLGCFADTLKPLIAAFKNDTTLIWTSQLTMLRDQLAQLRDILDEIKRSGAVLPVQFIQGKPRTKHL